MGILIGHGEHDGTQTVKVPAGLQVDFYAYEDSPLPIAILIELLKRGDNARPIVTPAAGESVPNYVYKPWKPHQIAGVKTVRRDWADTLIIGDPGAQDELPLCSNPANCERRKQHDQCTGVFGRAVQRHWTRLQILCCRTKVEDEAPPTKVIKGADGSLDKSFYEAFFSGVMNFVASTPAEKDKIWKSWDPGTQTYQIAVDQDMEEFAACYKARQDIDKKKEPTAKAETIRALPAPLVLQLLRDYPEYREPAAAAHPLDPADKAAIGAFLQAEYPTQEVEWLEKLKADQNQLVSWMIDKRIASWFRLFITLQYITFGLHGKALASMFRQLEPAQRKIVLDWRPALRDDLTTHAPDLLTA